MLCRGNLAWLAACGPIDSAVLERGVASVTELVGVTANAAADHDAIAWVTMVLNGPVGFQVTSCRPPPAVCHHVA